MDGSISMALSTTGAMKSCTPLPGCWSPRFDANSKAGTVTDDMDAAVKAVEAGRVEFKMDKTGALAVALASVHFPGQLEENAKSA